MYCSIVFFAKASAGTLAGWRAGHRLIASFCAHPIVADVWLGFEVFLIRLIYSWGALGGSGEAVLGLEIFPRIIALGSFNIGPIGFA
jgi:hypothetical protein